MYGPETLSSTLRQENRSQAFKVERSGTYVCVLERRSEKSKILHSDEIRVLFMSLKLVGQ